MNTITKATTVYAGPSDSGTYARIGSLSAGDSYTVIWNEFGFQYVEYTVSAGIKRGYISGGTNLIPSGFDQGVCGTMKSAQTVWSRPGDGKISMGSVSSDENVSILIPNSSGFSYIEYGSGSGTKRGWVSSIAVTYQSGTALAKMTQSTSTYSDANTLLSKSGSLGVEEFVVVLAENSVCARVEYCTSSSPYRKQAYIPINTYNRLNKWAYVELIPEPEQTGVAAAMNAYSSVYSGPDDYTYVNIGSVSNNENVSVIFAEFDWFCIDYSTSNGTKRGYVPKTSVANATSIMQQVHDRTRSNLRGGYCDQVMSQTTAYTGPSAAYTTSGTIGSSETVTRFAEEVNGFALIEFYTASGVKRGFITNTALKNLALGVIGYATDESSPGVYYDPSQNYSSGAIGRNEYVTVLLKSSASSENYSYFVEYNTTSGRKRGFVNPYLFTVNGSEDSIPDHPEVTREMTSTAATSVYSGPGDTYPQIGSLAANENVTVIHTDGDYSYVQYTSGTNLKCGYVRSPLLTDSEFSIKTYFDHPNVAEVIEYGKSGLGRSLHAYRLGNGRNCLMLNYAIHGWEDEYNHSGRDIEKVGEKTLEYLLDNIDVVRDNDWTVYVILTSNPDGLLDGTGHNGPGRCTIMRYGDSRNELVKGGIDINRSFESNFEAQWSSRNYTGPEANWCPESEALRDFITTRKSENGNNVFIDTHGFTTQIISYGTDSTIYDIFHTYFSGGGYEKSNYDTTNGKGYVAAYTHLKHNMDSCLFEFPSKVTDNGSTRTVASGDLARLGYDSKYINAIIDILTSEHYMS